MGAEFIGLGVSGVGSLLGYSAAQGQAASYRRAAEQQRVNAEHDASIARRNAEMQARAFEQQTRTDSQNLITQAQMLGEQVSSKQEGDALNFSVMDAEGRTALAASGGRSTAALMGLEVNRSRFFNNQRTEQVAAKYATQGLLSNAENVIRAGHESARNALLTGENQAGSILADGSQKSAAYQQQASGAATGGLLTAITTMANPALSFLRKP